MMMLNITSLKSYQNQSIVVEVSRSLSYFSSCSSATSNVVARPRSSARSRWRARSQVKNPFDTTQQITGNRKSSSGSHP